jgi:hypothetical protein
LSRELREMPKKLPMSEKREWLTAFDEGKPAAQIARERKHAIKVIKRGIEEARAERDGATARAEIVKGALIKHQKQLLGIVDKFYQAAEVPPADLELRRDKSGALEPIPLPYSMIVYTPEKGLTVELPDENTTQWGLLREHLARDRVWSAIRNWKESLISHVRERMELESAIKISVENETGFKVSMAPPGDQEPNVVYDFTVKLFYIVQIRKALGILDKTNPQDRMIASDDGYVRHGEGGSEMAYCPNKQNECREALITAFNKIPDLPEMKKVIITEIELKNTSSKLKRPLEDIRLMGLVPGRCRICSRIGL